MDEKKSVMAHPKVVPIRRYRRRQYGGDSPQRISSVSSRRRSAVLSGPDRRPPAAGRYLSSSLTLWNARLPRAYSEKRGPVTQKTDPYVRRNAELEKENARLTHKLKQAELIIDVQKKVAELLTGSSEEKS